MKSHLFITVIFLNQFFLLDPATKGWFGFDVLYLCTRPINTPLDKFHLHRHIHPLSSYPPTMPSTSFCRMPAKQFTAPMKSNIISAGTPWGTNLSSNSLDQVWSRVVKVGQRVARMGTNMVPSQDIVEDSFTFAKVGYNSFLEGRGLDKVVRVQACKVAHTFCWGCRK